jgi:hypothetical protein
MNLTSRLRHDDDMQPHMDVITLVVDDRAHSCLLPRAGLEQPDVTETEFAVDATTPPGAAAMSQLALIDTSIRLRSYGRMRGCRTHGPAKAESFSIGHLINREEEVDVVWC